MNLFTTVLLALSVASLGTAVPLDNYGAFASSLSAGPTNVVDSHGGGVGNMPNLQFSRMKQHGDGQNPIFVDGEPVRLAGHAAPKSSSTSKESGVKTVYHNNQLGVSVPTLEEFNSRGKAQAVSLLKKQTRGKSSISPQQKSVIQQRLNALTSSDGASVPSAYAHHAHTPVHHKSAQHKKGPKRLHVSKNGKSASKRSSSAGVARPSSVSLNKEQLRLLQSASKMVESMAKRHDGHVFEAIESVSDDGSSKTSSASSSDAPVSTKSKSSTSSKKSSTSSKKSSTSSKKNSTSSKKSSTSSDAKSTTTSSKKSAVTSAKGKMRKCRPRKKFTSNASVKTVTLSPSSTSSSSKGHGVTVSQGSSESLRYGKTISLGDDRSVDDGSDVIQKLLL
ncbi:SRP40, C-terminal domain protein [Malassezia restricta]|uniref:SRP40, C-terminal domain protein n=1 Tax=Malassezia restricta TaxID=76775 RepID=UPI000DD0FE0E|nr:SRP40, C-terminal domain protein [Malassezia restricta]AXA51664.1 SRP40, C-terminal domain protein [Malassezia restricta]